MTLKDLSFQRIPIFLALLILSVESNRINNRINKFPVDIYYSVTDPASILLLKGQLKSLTNTFLSDYINVHILPFAGCELEEDTKRVSCDSGKSQVEASLHHMCAFHLMNTKRSHLFSFNVEGLKYVICTMEKITKSSKQLDLEGCADEAKGLTNEIENCVKEEDKDLITENFEIINEVKFRNSPSVAMERKSFPGTLLPLPITCNGTEESRHWVCNQLLDLTTHVPTDGASGNNSCFTLLYKLGFSLLVLVFLYRKFLINLF